MFTRFTITAATAVLLAISIGQSANAQGAGKDTASSMSGTVTFQHEPVPAGNASRATAAAPPAHVAPAHVAPAYVAPAVQTPSSAPVLQTIRR